VSSTIVATSYYVPDGRLTHQQLQERFGAEQIDKIAESSGIFERRVALENECASDLAYRAAIDLFDNSEFDPSEVELVIFASQTPDYLLPTTACILQERLGIPTTAGAFDINLGCSQYVYALSVAHSMIASGVAKNALVMTGDTVSRILHPMDRTVVPLFGDAGTATFVKKSEDSSGFLGFELGSDGSGAKHLIWPTSGLREDLTEEAQVEVTDKSGAVRRRSDMYMDGAAIFLFTMKTVPKLVKNLLGKTDLELDDIDLFVFHQASELIVETAVKKLKIPKEKTHYKLHDLGNSGGSTVAIALTDAWLAGKVKPGMKILLAAFGVGLSWAGTVIEWSDSSVAICNVDYEGSPKKPSAQDV
jgi:3-oxoacyl-[acyl-carrier-protein] synthase-3